VLTVLLYFLGSPATWMATLQAAPKLSLISAIGLIAIVGSGLALRSTDSRN
jgi:hypothetical protein